jgi:transposase
VTIVAHAYQFVVGVDTHARTHALSSLTAATGAVGDESQFSATEAGMARAIAWVGRRTDGDMATLWVVEGIGSYGARLAAVVAQSGYQPVEAARMDARGNRGVGKSDPPAPARSPAPSSSGPGVRIALRVLVAARDQMTTERTAAINALTALLRTFAFGIDARKALTSAQIAEAARWRTREEDGGSVSSGLSGCPGSAGCMSGAPPLGPGRLASTDSLKIVFVYGSTSRLSRRWPGRGCGV